MQLFQTSCFIKLALPTNWRRRSFGSSPYLLRKRLFPLSIASLHVVYNEQQYNHYLRTTACVFTDVLVSWRDGDAACFAQASRFVMPVLATSKLGKSFGSPNLPIPE